MKNLTSAMALAALCALAFSPLAGSSEKPVVGSVRLGAAASSPFLLAQADPPPATCQVDGRKVPVGTMYCLGGKEQRCASGGTWVQTGKGC